MTRNLWEFMEFYTGHEGQRILSPMLGDLPTNLRTITERHYNPRAELFRQMLPTSTSRPPLPVGSVAWDTLQRSRSSVIIGSQTPQEAVATNHLSVAPKMALFEGYRAERRDPGLSRTRRLDEPRGCGLAARLGVEATTDLDSLLAREDLDGVTATAATSDHVEVIGDVAP